MNAAATAAAALSFRALPQLTSAQDPTAIARYLAYLAAAGAVADSFNVDEAYDCSTSPISQSVLCLGGGSGQFVAAGENIHAMPEINIVLADRLDHAFVGCYNSPSTQPARLYVFGGSVTEGAPGDRNLLPFTIERTGALTGTASANYMTQPGPVGADNAIPGQDYEPASGTVVFAPGQERMIINVTVLGDSVTEGNEHVYLRLTNVSGAELPDNPVATGGIANDDGS